MAEKTQVAKVAATDSDCRIREMYKAEVVPYLMKRFNYKNVNQVPKLVKITGKILWFKYKILHRIHHNITGKFPPFEKHISVFDVSNQLIPCIINIRLYVIGIIINRNKMQLWNGLF